jgi:hypothetical protein
MARRKDENQTAFSGLEELLRKDDIRDGLKVTPIPLEEKDPKAVRAGKLGGIKGGKARAKSLSYKKRINIAKKAAKTRWKRSKDHSLL